MTLLAAPSDRADYERAACPLCGSDRDTPYLTGPDRLHHLGGDFTLVRCLDCTLIYQNPRPTLAAIGAYYPPDYLPHQVGQERPTLFSRIALRRAVTKRAGAVERYRKGGAILDLGCGTGAFLAEMQRRGWKALGVDTSAAAIAVAQQTFGIPARTGTLESLRLPDASFDVVTLWDVIEHLHDPAATVREIRRVLRTDGVLVVSTPDIRSLDSRLFGRYWAGLDLPRHLALFSPATLARLLEEAQFEVVDRIYFTGNYHTLRLSCQFLFDARLRSPRPREILTRIVRSPVTWGLSMPFALVCNALKVGPVMTVIARAVSGTRAPCSKS